MSSQIQTTTTTINTPKTRKFGTNISNENGGRVNKTPRNVAPYIYPKKTTPAKTPIANKSVTTSSAPSSTTTIVSNNVEPKKRIFSGPPKQYSIPELMKFRNYCYKEVPLPLLEEHKSVYSPFFPKDVSQTNAISIAVEKPIESQQQSLVVLEMKTQPIITPNISETAQISIPTNFANVVTPVQHPYVASHDVPFKPISSVTVTSTSAPFRYPKPNPRKKETNEVRLASRQKQINIGKKTLGWLCFSRATAEQKATVTFVPIPDIYQICSKRSWDGQVKKWRRSLHEFDKFATEEELKAQENSKEVEEKVDDGEEEEIKIENPAVKFDDDESKVDLKLDIEEYPVAKFDICDN